MITHMFEEYLDYCKEDNEQLAKDTETWLADFFDLQNRTEPITDEESNWINENLSEEAQRRILDCKINDFESIRPELYK